MRVLHYLPSLNLERGGPVRAVMDLAEGLSRRGNPTTIVTTELGDAPKAWDGSDIKKPRIVGMPGDCVGAKSLGSRRRAIAAELVGAHDMVHVHGAWNYSNVEFARLATRMGKPYAVSPRGMLDDWSMEQKALKKRVYLRLFGTSFLNNAAAVHCTAQGELDQSRKWFPRGHGVVLPNLLVLDPYRTPPGPEAARAKFPLLASGAVNVLFLSRLHYKKGVEVLLDAGGLLRERGVAVNLIIAGSGDEPYVSQLKARVAKLGLEANTVFTGHVNGTLKTSLYQAADIFALPTSQENFGFVFPEALASGTPVITTKGVDIWPELIESGGSAIVERTAPAFADAIADLATNPAKRKAMGERGKPWVFKVFDEEGLLGRYEAMYAACIERMRGVKAAG